MVELDLQRISRNAQILKFAADQKDVALIRSLLCPGRLLKARRKTRDNPVRGYDIQDVQPLDRSGRMSRMGRFAILLLHTTGDVRVRAMERDNLIDPEVFNV